MAAGGLYAGGAFQGGEVYDLPLAEARAELVAMPLPPTLLQASGSDSAAVSVDSSDRRVEWRVSLGSQDMARFTATLDAEGAERTRVTLTHSAADTTSYAGRLVSSGFLSSYAEASFAEQVDAQLERRAFDQGRAVQAFAQHVRDNPDEVRELGNTVRDMFVEIGEQARENANAGAVPRTTEQSMRAATRPAVDLSKYD